jgi:hypothetical protein
LILGNISRALYQANFNTDVYNVAVKDNVGKIQEVKVNAQTGVVIKVDAADGENQDDEVSDIETADDNK